MLFSPSRIQRLCLTVIQAKSCGVQVRFIEIARHKFVDKCRLEVSGGKGGKGIISFESITNEKKKSIGGHGGKGGDVIVEASSTVHDLNFQTFVINGRPGTDASKNGKNGKAGRVKKVMVPVGTIVKEVSRVYDFGHEEADPNSEEDTSELSELVRSTKAGIPFREKLTPLVDLDSSGASIIVARGGLPGMGNRGSKETYSEQIKSKISAHIRSRSEPELRFLELELKLIAKVGLVGFPNAGKSTFLSAISNAKPKIAEYPFTTLHPILGTIRYGDGYELSVADIPGIIEGASDNRGLGFEFLRHIQRTQILAYVIDTTSPSPHLDLKVLQRELQLYDKTLPLKPSIIVANKTDHEDQSIVDRGLKLLQQHTMLPVFRISAKHKQGLQNVMNSLRWLVEQAESSA
jgi:GTPase